MCLTARKPNLLGLATMPPTIATEYLACGLFFIDVIGLPIKLDFTVWLAKIISLPVSGDFYHLLIIFLNCLTLRIFLRIFIKAQFLPPPPPPPLNILSLCWNFIKQHIFIYKTNTLNKKIRARGNFFLSYSPL